MVKLGARLIAAALFFFFFFSLVFDSLTTTSISRMDLAFFTCRRRQIKIRPYVSVLLFYLTALALGVVQFVQAPLYTSTHYFFFSFYILFNRHMQSFASSLYTDRSIYRRSEKNAISLDTVVDSIFSVS